jgi:hypothetical protein
MLSENDQLAEDFGAHLAWWLRGTLDDVADLAEAIFEAKQTHFPWRPAAHALAAQGPRRLWRALDDECLQDLYDMAKNEGLDDAAAAFEAAVLARPHVDDGRIPPELRAFVMARDARQCQVCGSEANLTIDHKWIAWSDGGSSTDPQNLQVLCRSCNSRKGRRPWNVERAA